MCISEYHALSSKPWKKKTPHPKCANATTDHGAGQLSKIAATTCAGCVGVRHGIICSLMEFETGSTKRCNTMQVGINKGAERSPACNVRVINKLLRSSM